MATTNAKPLYDKIFMISDKSYVPIGKVSSVTTTTDDWMNAIDELNKSTLLSFYPSSGFTFTFNMDSCAKHGDDVYDVKVFNDADGNPKTVKVYFTDNTAETATVDKDDTFSLDTGITICIMKHILGGSSEYNRLIRSAVKKMNSNRTIERKAEEEKAMIARKKAKRAAQKEKRRLRKEEAEINKIAEAIRRANKEN